MGTAFQQRAQQGPEALVGLARSGRSKEVRVAGTWWFGIGVGRLRGGGGEANLLDVTELRGGH